MPSLSSVTRFASPPRRSSSQSCDPLPPLARREERQVPAVRTPSRRRLAVGRRRHLNRPACHPRSPSRRRCRSCPSPSRWSSPCTPTHRPSGESCGSFTFLTRYMSPSLIGRLATVPWAPAIEANPARSNSDGGRKRMTVLLRHLRGDSKSGQRGTLCLRPDPGAGAMRRASCDPPSHLTMRLSTLSALLTASAAGSPAAVRRPQPRPHLRHGPYDVIIENGRVVDGTGAAWFYGDIGIRGRPHRRRHAARHAAHRNRHDARRRARPRRRAGIHRHPGSIGWPAAPRRRTQLGKITQGVTTGILGEGSTPAPLNPAYLPTRRDRAAATFAEPHGFDAWLSAMEAHGISQNVGSFVGAGTIRAISGWPSEWARRPGRRSTRCAARSAARWKTARSGWRAR